MGKRNYHVDLFRIIAAFLVILLHVLGQGGVLNNTTPGETKYWIAWFLEISAYCAVDCFALITGYVMVNKSIKVKNIINLWFQVLFYSLSLTALFFVFMPESRSSEYLIPAVMPILGRQWWYVSAYVALFFFIPFLNEAINHLPKQTYKKFLLLTLIGVGFLDSIVPADAFPLDKGYSVIWFIVVYLFGAYIRKYDCFEKTTAFKCIAGFVVMVVLTLASKTAIRSLAESIFGDAKYENTFIRFLTESTFGDAKYEDAFLTYTSITVFLSAIFLFLFCLKIKIGNIASKVIAFVSPAALGVYLIHVHPLVFKYLMKDAFVSFAAKSPMVMILSTMAACVSIFVLCMIIELLRIQIFKWIRVGRLSELIARKMNGFYLRVSK